MRKTEKEITEQSAIEAVINQALVCRLGLSDNNIPYVVPVCFGYKDRTLYVHGSLKGKKAGILKKNHNVCVEFDINTEVKVAETACDWDMKYQSVIGFGKASFVEDPNDKQKALKIIMDQYSDKLFPFSEHKSIVTAVIKIELSSMTGKQSGF